MKRAERLDIEDKLLHITQKHDVTATLKRAELMRQAQDAGVQGSIPADWKAIGTVPGVLVRAWANEAGVRMDDGDAMRDLINKKLMSGEFSKLRVTPGKFII